MLCRDAVMEMTEIELWGESAMDDVIAAGGSASCACSHVCAYITCISCITRSVRCQLRLEARPRGHGLDNVHWRRTDQERPAHRGG